MDYGLGRLHSIDLRDINHLMSFAIPEDSIVGRQRAWWDGTFWPNQYSTPHCVEYAWHNYVAALPINHPSKAPFWEYGTVYDAAQKVDEWPGEDYDGTSVRAGAKVLQSLGFIEGYKWAFDVETVLRHLLFEGPVVVGTNWYTNMFYPDSTGKVSVGGYVEGGHAYLLTGANMNRGRVRAKQTWGREWGFNGRFWMTIDDLARLIEEDGEACIATEVAIL